MKFGDQNLHKAIEEKEHKKALALNSPKSSIKSDEEQINAHFNTKKASEGVHGEQGGKESTVPTGPKEGRGRRGDKNNGKYL